MNAIDNRVKAVFLEALETGPPERWDDFLRGACGDDEDLLRRVKVLLDAQRGADSLLDGPGLVPTVAKESPTAEAVGTVIGPYTLREQIGEGGMGVVYVAEQSHPVRRKVALKVIKPGMDTKQVVARFEAERQALAMMDHQNIAKVLDAGTTDSGRPYFVMELVPGVPITEYCDGQRLSVRQRLELFVLVCRAVQHAHQKGIIHRDLKPSNILVTLHDGVPVPKVIDFGVAKAMGQSLTEKTVYTALSQLVGTPLYMSPEQAEMNQFGVDTRSDVYSLGVLLYELLTGTTPFDKEALGGSGLEEMRRMIREDEPPRPSARVSSLHPEALSTTSQRRSTDPRRISAALHGELDWIVMKSLEKDRSRRYESASAFATDIQRYLDDEPVLAGPPSTMYKFHKFARKHRAALATAVAISASLILGTTASAWQAVRATTAEAQANANATQAQEKAEEATTQRDLAQKQRDEVQALNEKLQATQAELRDTLYAAHMNLAHNAWETGGLGRTRQLLERYRPKPGESDLRGFEWFYLQRLNHSDLLTLTGHSGMVTGVAFSPDGQRLASCSNDQTVKLWDAQTGQVVRTLQTRKSDWDSVVFSPDGKRLASGSKVWDAHSGQEIVTLRGFPTFRAFSPDGQRVAGARNQGEVTIWDAQTGQVLSTWKGHIRTVWSVAVSPDGKHMASGSHGGTAKVWDAQTGQELLSLEGHVGAVMTVVFSPDGKRLASCSDDKTVKLREVATGQELFTLKGHTAEVRSVAFSPDGKRLASTSEDGTVKVWDVQTGQELFTLKGHTSEVKSVAFSPDGKRLASASRDGTVKLWQAQASQGSIDLKGGTDRVWGVAFSPDGKRLASVSDDHKVGQTGYVTARELVFRPTRVKVWDAQTGQDLRLLEGHTAMVWSVAFSPDGKRLASASADKTVKVWDTQTGQELLTLKGHTGTVWSVVFSPDGQRLATASHSTVKVWDAQSGQETLSLKGAPTPGFNWPNMGLAFSPDGKRLAFGAEDTSVKVCDAQSGQELLALKTRGPVFGLAFSPDGKHLARAGNQVKVWDAQTGQETTTLVGQGFINSVAFNPDGHRLATASSDGMVKVWNARTGQETLTLRGHTGRVLNVVFSPDGNRLASNGNDGTVKIWDATPLPQKP